MSNRKTSWQECKDPSDVDFYDVVISPKWLGYETIDSASFVAPEGSGLTIGGVDTNGNIARTRIGGGYPGEHAVEFTATTSPSGRVIQRSIYLRVAER